MKSILKPALGIGILYSICAFLWLTVANSDTPAPGKEIIFLFYVILLSILPAKAKSFTVWLMTSLLVGILCEVATWSLAAWRFHGLMHDLEHNLETFFIGVFCFSSLHLVYGSIVLFIHNNKITD